MVRDDNKVIVFNSEGKFLRTLWQDKGQVKCYGLAQDKEGRVITIMETRNHKKTDLLFFDQDQENLSGRLAPVCW